MLQPATQTRSGWSARVPAHEIGNDLLRQQFEGLRVAEKAGDVDQQILGEKIEFSRILAAAYRDIGPVVDPASAMRRSIRRDNVPGL